MIDTSPYVDVVDFDSLIDIDQDHQEILPPGHWDNALDFKGYFPKHKDLRLRFKTKDGEVSFLIEFGDACFINEKSHAIYLIPGTYKKTPDII